MNSLISQRDRINALNSMEDIKVFAVESLDKDKGIDIFSRFLYHSLYTLPCTAACSKISSYLKSS